MLSWLERGFSVLMLLYLSSGLTSFLAGDSPFNVWRIEDNPLLLGIQLAMYATMLGFVVLHWRKVVNALPAARWVLLLAILAVMSSLWSSDPAFTFRRSLVLAATTIFGIYFGSRFDFLQQVRLLAWAVIILAVLCAGCALWFPQYGIDNQLHRGDWQGVLGQKNLLGKAMVVAIVVLWSAKGMLPRAVRFSAMGLCAGVMLMSGSRVALVVLAALALLLPVYPIMRARISSLLPLATLVLAVSAGLMFVLAENSSQLVSVLGREPTLTRRTQIWSAVWAARSSHLALGYGFSSFWSGLHRESARIAAMLGFVPRHAHNGFLDLWLELGLTGLLVFLAGYFQAVRHGWKLLRIRRDRLATWPLQYLAFLLLYDLVEGPILRANSLYWALYVAVVVSTTLAISAGETPELPWATSSPGYLEPQPDYLSRRIAGPLGNLHPAPGRSAA
jgi:exopolysaccharide production protein ExoQ